MKNLISLLFVWANCLSHAQDFSKLDSPVPQDKEVKIGVLENGLKYYIRQNLKPENKVELRLVVNAGSILENEKQRGLAHFMEHMNFNGTKNFQHNELVDYLQSIGVQFGQHLNAYTSFDETVYILPIPSDDAEKLEKGFDILEDWAFNNLLTPEEIEKERGVVLEELRLGLGGDQRMLERYLPLLMHDSHYANRLPIGLKSVIESFEHSELKDFYTTWYRPNLMSVVVVGDIDVAEMEQKIKLHFGNYKNPQNAKERIEFYVPDHEETFVAIEQDKEAGFTQVQLVYKDKANATKVVSIADYRQSIVINLFNTMINSRLEEIANGDDPPYTYGYSYHGSDWSRNKTSYQSFALTDAENQLRAFEILVDENERVQRFGFVEAELDRAKKSLLSSLASLLKNKDKTESSRLVYEYVNHFLQASVIPGIEWEYNAHLELLKGISLKEVNGLISQFIHDDNRVVVFTGPEVEGGSRVNEAQILDVLKNVKTKKLDAYDDGVVATSLISVMPTGGTVKSTERLETLDMTKMVLSNGVTVYYKKTDFSDNEILLRAYSPGGTSVIQSADDFKKVNLALGGLTESGLNNFSLNDMAKIMAGKEVRVSPFISRDFEGFWGKTVNNDLEDMFQLIYLNFTALNKNEEAYKGFAEKQIGFLGSLLNTPEYWYRNEKAKVIEKNNPRFMNSIPTKEEFDRQDYQMAYDVYKDRFSDAGDFVFLFVGSFEEAQLIEFSEKYLGSLPSTGRKESFVHHDYERLTGKNEFVFKKGEDQKSSVEINFRTEAPYDARQAYYLKCAGEILSIKLIENLREDESGVYGVGASGYASKIPEGSYIFTISFPCGPENVEKLKQAALDELNKLLVNGPDPKDLEKIKEAQKLELKENLKKNDYWISELFNLVVNGTAITEFQYDELEINALSAEDVKKAANLYIAGNVIITVLMPE